MRWQTNEFRSSQNVSRAPYSPFLAESEASKGALVAHSVVLTTEFCVTHSQSALSFRNHYSETRFAARGDPETTPKLDLLPSKTLADDEEFPRWRLPRRFRHRCGRDCDKGLLVHRLKHSCYRLWEISEMAVRPDSISSGVLKWEKLKRTTPLSAVPRALCMSGAQWAPGRVQMP